MLISFPLLLCVLFPFPRLFFNFVRTKSHRSFAVTVGEEDGGFKSLTFLLSIWYWTRGGVLLWMGKRRVRGDLTAIRAPPPLFQNPPQKISPQSPVRSDRTRQQEGHKRRGEAEKKALSAFVRISDNLTTWVGRTLSEWTWKRSEGKCLFSCQSYLNRTIQTLALVQIQKRIEN